MTKKKKCVYFKGDVLYDALLGRFCHVRCEDPCERDHCIEQLALHTGSSRVLTFGHVKRLATLCPHRVLVPVPIKSKSKTERREMVKLCTFCRFFCLSPGYHWVCEDGVDEGEDFEIYCGAARPTAWGNARTVRPEASHHFRRQILKARNCACFEVVGGDNGAVAKYLRGESIDE